MNTPDQKKIFLSHPPLWVWFAVMGIFALDQIAKYEALSAMPVGGVKQLFPGLSLMLTFNSGAAFSFLASSGGWQRYFFMAAAVVVSVWLIQELRRPLPMVQRWGTLLILGGALGNLYDRIVHGHVIDFILVYWRQWSFPVFNLADTAITCGVGFLLLGLFWHCGLEKSTRAVGE